MKINPKDYSDCNAGLNKESICSEGFEQKNVIVTFVSKYFERMIRAHEFKLFYR
jgi:hypothetical protein